MSLVKCFDACCIVRIQFRSRRLDAGLGTYEHHLRWFTTRLIDVVICVFACKRESLVDVGKSGETWRLEQNCGCRANVPRYECGFAMKYRNMKNKTFTASGRLQFSRRLLGQKLQASSC